MLDYIKRIFSNTQSAPKPPTEKVERVDAASTICGINGASFDLAKIMLLEEGLPVPDWIALNDWIETIDTTDRGRVWADAELAWLSCLRSALGDTYKISRFRQAVVLSSLSSRQEQLVMAFMDSSIKRIVKTLGRIASVPEWGYDILIVLDDEDTYYRYISRYYPEEGEFSISSGVHIGYGCSHFVTTKQEMRLIEPVIVHEMTHSCVAHLPIPAWLNEGLAVNTEHSVCGSSDTDADTPARHNQHRNFWNPNTVQQLWSGASFKRTDEGSLLSYDLARILVSQMGKSWEQFEAFVLDADLNDSGQRSANEKYGMSLGAMVCALLDQQYSPAWEPMPEKWNDAPERGAFRVADRLPVTENARRAM